MKLKKELTNYVEEFVHSKHNAIIVEQLLALFESGMLEVIGEYEDGNSGQSFGYYNSSTNKEQNARNEFRASLRKKVKEMLY